MSKRTSGWRKRPPSVSEVLAGQKWWARKQAKFLGGYYETTVEYAVVNDTKTEICFKPSNRVRAWHTVYEGDLWYPLHVPE